MKKIIKNILTNILCAIYNIKCGKGYYIGPHLHVYNIKKKLTIGKKVEISAYTTLLCVTPEARISMGDNIRIAHHLQIGLSVFFFGHPQTDPFDRYLFFHKYAGHFYHRSQP